MRAPLFVAFALCLTSCLASVYNMITKSDVTTPWLEIGYFDLDDISWVTINSNVTTFVNPVVFLSLPEIPGNTFNDGYAVSSRLRNVKLVNNIVSFDAKLYQPNDTHCLKTWWTPKYINPHILVSYTIAERGAYNISGNFFFIGAENITRPEKSTFNTDNHQRIYYPNGCVSSTEPCAFPDGSTVGGITQVQTLVNDRFLLVRGAVFALRFARYLLTPHDSVDENYQVMKNPEVMAFMVFRTSNGISCVEGLGFEANIIPGVSENAITQNFVYNYQYAPGVYGMINTVRGQDSVGLRTFNKGTSSTRLITQEDQCFDEETAHTNLETVALVVMGHIIPTSLSQECKVKFTPPTIPDPTIAPTPAPTASPTRAPTSRPSAVPTTAPTYNPTTAPSFPPTSVPTRCPTEAPTSSPTFFPTAQPTSAPTFAPSVSPSFTPTSAPTALPTSSPTVSPTSAPTFSPTVFPTSAPSSVPTVAPTSFPTVMPTYSPTASPTLLPTASPTFAPTCLPTPEPTVAPTNTPTSSPTTRPTYLPTSAPTFVPTVAPTMCPTLHPTGGPTLSSTTDPTFVPTSAPSHMPTHVPSSWPSCSPTLLPTASPTFAPTYLPTPEPTVAPTSTPTSSPTTRPTYLPTSAPTFVPTVAPTMCPTLHPTGGPTLSSTADPTFVPTSAPSHLPTSSVPTYHPTSFPTGSPTFSPTQFPTVAPTFGPTEIPSTFPTVFPTSLPSANPTTFPTCTPTLTSTSILTFTPTTTPTSFPTLVPTSLPTTALTFIPSSSPTRSPTHIPTTLPTAPPTSTPITTPTYAPSVVPTATPTAFPTYFPTAKPSVLPTAHPTFLPSVAPTCAPSAIPTISPTLEPSNSPTCSPSTLPTLNPTSSPSVAPSIEPTDMPTLVPTVPPSARPTASPTAFPSHEPTFHPTFIPSLTPTEALTQSPTLIPTFAPTIALTLPPTLPTALPACIAGEKSITVKYDLGAPGKFHCAAFEGSVMPSLGTVKNIAFHEGANFTYTMSTASGYMELQNLKGGTGYHVLCYEELFVPQDGQTSTPLEDVYAKSCFVQTSCCKEVYLTKVRRVYAVGDVSEPIVISLSSLPSDVVTVAPLIHYSAHCDKLSATLMTSVLPSDLTFTESTGSTTGVMMFQMAESGCYYITMEMSGPSSDEFLFRDDVVTVVALNDTTAPKLELSRIYVDETGSSFHVEFSASTDRGAAFGLKPYAPFDCSLVATFVSANESTCVFIDDETLEITPPSGYTHTVPSVGDNIVLKGGWLKGKCVQKSCPEYPYLDPVADVLRPPLGHILVDAVIVGATEVSESLILDISTSSGHGNRPFLIEWKVLNASTGESIPVLEAYFNGLQWQNCPYATANCNVVPRSQFPRDGEYTLILKLQNYLGEFDVTTITVTVRDGTLSHYLLNNYYLLLRKYEQTFQFETHGLYASLALDDAVDVEWHLVNLNGSEVNTTNMSNDKRRFRTAPYTFDTFHAYSISSTVTLRSSGVTATARRTIYIIQGKLHVLIQNGVIQTHYDNTIFHLNATASYDDDRYDTDIKFTWTCMRSKPFSGSCPGFDELNAEHQSLITLDTSLMSTDSTYIFLLHITDGFRQDTQIVVVHITSTTVPTLQLRQSSLNSSEYMLISRLDYSISPFDAAWNRNGDLLISERFQARTIPFPYRVHLGAAPGSYTFLLSMTPLRCSDGDTQITDCATAYFGVEYETNRAPRAGSLSSWPTTGNTDTLFHFYAAGWTDADLPLTFKYFQYSEHHDEYLLIQQASPKPHANALLTRSNRTNNILVRVFDALENYAEVMVTVAVSQATPVLATRNITLSGMLGDFDRILQYVQLHQYAMHETCALDTISCLNFTVFDTNIVRAFWSGIDIDFDVLDTTTWLINGTVDIVDIIKRVSWDQSLWDSTIELGSTVMDTIQSRGFRASAEYVLVERLVVSNEYLLFMYFDYQLGAGRRLQATGVTIDDIHANTMKLVNTIYAALVLGESYELQRNYYSIAIAKDRPNSHYLPASTVDWLVMDRDTAFSNETIAYGYTAVKFNSESSNCTDNTNSCDAFTDTITSSIYVVSSLNVPALPVTETIILAHNIDGALERLEPLSFVDECSGENKNVTFLCNVNETWGRPYSEATLQCNDKTGTWEYTCPEYSITPICRADEKCSVVSESETELVCECEVDYSSATATAVLPVPFDGFATYKRSNVNNALYEKRLVSPAVKEFTRDSSTLSNPTDNSIVLQISILLPVCIFLCCCLLLLLLFCMTRVDIKDEWLKLNNKPTGLRDFVNIYRTEDDTIGLEDVKFYMQRVRDVGDPLEADYALALPSYAEEFDTLKYGEPRDTGIVGKRQARKQLTIATDPLVAMYNEALPLYTVQYAETINDKDVDDDATADETDYLSLQMNLSMLPPMPPKKEKNDLSPQNTLRQVLVPQLGMQNIRHDGDEVTPRSRAYVDGFLFTARTADSSDSNDELEVLHLHQLDSSKHLRPPRLTPRSRETQSRSCELFFAPEERR